MDITVETKNKDMKELRNLKIDLSKKWPIKIV